MKAFSKSLFFMGAIFFASSAHVSWAGPNSHDCDASVSAKVSGRQSIHQWKFLWQFLKSPGSIGSVMPSSQALANAMVDAADLLTAQVVVELGVGTGPVTRAILSRIDSKTQFIGFEPNEKFHPLLNQQFPGREFLARGAQDLPKILKEKSLDNGADVIFSELPWTIFPEALQDELLVAIKDSLAPKGRMVMFLYGVAMTTPKGRRFARKLRENFGVYEEHALVYKNFPPARVIELRK